MKSWNDIRVQTVALEKARMKAETFAPKGYEVYFKGVDAELAKTSLMPETRNEVLFAKAIVLMDAVDSDEAIRNNFRIDAANILRNLFDNPVNTQAGKKLKEKAILAYMLDFNQRFFLSGNTMLLPDAYKGPYLKLYQASSTTKVKGLEFQKLAFQTFIRLSNDPSIETMSKDKTFISNRMYLVATYLAGFYSSLTQEERATLLTQLKQDIETYPFTSNIIFSDIRHTKLVADFYYAYAYGVHTIMSKPVDMTDQLKIAGKNYENARKNVDLTGGFLLTNATMGQYIDAFNLSFLTLTKVEGYQEKIDEIIKEMNVYSENRDSSIIVARFYANFLNTRGSWMGIKRNLVALNKVNSEYGAYLQKLGVTLK